MAQNYIGINRGQADLQTGLITAYSTTQSTDFELRWDGTKSSTKKDLILAIRAIQQFIENDGIANGVANGSFLPPN